MKTLAGGPFTAGSFRAMLWYGHGIESPFLGILRSRFLIKARRDSSVEAINHACEIKARSERRIGELEGEAMKPQEFGSKGG